MIDDEMKNVLNIFSAIILCDSGSDIHLDYTDFVCALENTTGSYIVSFHSDVTCSVSVMMKQIVQEVLWDNDLKDKIAAILINFKLHPDFDLEDLSVAMENIYENTNEHCTVIFGTCTDNKMGIDDMSVNAIISYV